MNNLFVSIILVLFVFQYAEAKNFRTYHYTPNQYNMNYNNNYGNFARVEREGNLKYPRSVLKFNRPHQPIHPTQKNVELCEWLVKTYTNENEVVLDNCMGSGSTGVACMNTNRKFIGIELDENYFNIAKNRIEENLDKLVG